MFRGLWLSLVIAVTFAAAAKAEPAIGFAYTYEAPSVNAHIFLMNEAAADTNYRRENWGQEIIDTRNKECRDLEDSLGTSLMLVTVMIRNTSASQDTLVFPGETEICIIHNGEYLTAVRPVPDVEVAPRHTTIFFVVFRKYLMIEGDTLAMRPKESHRR